MANPEQFYKIALLSTLALFGTIASNERCLKMAIEPAYAQLNDNVAVSCAFRDDSCVNIIFAHNLSAVANNCSLFENFSNLTVSQCKCSSGIWTFQMNVSDEWYYGKWLCSIPQNATCVGAADLYAYVPSNISFVNEVDHVSEGENQFTCETYGGDPNATHIRWYLGTENIEECAVNQMEDDKYGCSLNMNITRDMHNDTLSCHAFQAEGKSMQKDEFNLIVHYDPGEASVTTKSDINYMTDVTLLCSVEDPGNPSCTDFFWDSNGTWFCPRSTEKEIICNVSDDCTTMTVCHCENYLGNGTRGQIILEVTDPAHIDQISGPTTVFNEDELQIICHVTGKPIPTVEWSYTSSLLKQNEQLSDEIGQCNTIHALEQRLHWEHSSMEERKTINGSKVACLTQNMDHSDEETITIIVEYAPGKFTIDASSYKADVNETIELSCVVEEGQEGNPPTNEYIFKNYSSRDNGTVSTLSILLTTITQIGPYKCKGSNTPNAGRKEGQWSEDILLDIFVPVEMKRPATGENFQPLYNDERFNISCDAVGKPRPYINLTVAGMDVSNAFKYREESFETDGQYDLDTGVRSFFTWKLPEYNVTCLTVTSYDDTYKCSAENQGPTGDLRYSQSANISVKTRYPALWNGSNDMAVYAEIDQSDFTIECDVCGNPFPNDGEYIWLFSKFNDSFEVISNQSRRLLSIQTIDQMDFGIYRCLVDNGIPGSTSFDIRLLEMGPPRIRGLLVSDKTSMSLTVHWGVVSGNNPPVNMSVEYREWNTKDFIESQSNMTSFNYVEEQNAVIVNLTASMFYEVKIIGINDYKNKSIAEDIINATTRDTPEVILNTVTLDDKEVHVTWLYTTSYQLGRDNYKVTVRSLYWHAKDTLSRKSYPDTVENAIDANELEMRFTDSDITEDYVLVLEVYENGMLNTNAASSPKDIIIQGLGGGAIFGIVLLCLLVIAVPAIVFLIYTGRVNVPFKSGEIAQDDPIIRGDASALEFSNPTYPANDQALGPVYAQVDKKRHINKEIGEETTNTYENVAFPGKPHVAPKPKTTEMKAKQKTSELPSTQGAIVKVKDKYNVLRTRVIYEQRRKNRCLDSKESLKDVELKVKDSDGCIYMRIDGLEFPKYKPPKKGKKPVIHGIEHLTIYATIDHYARAPTPPPVYEEEEEDVMDCLPYREPQDRDDI